MRKKLIAFSTAISLLLGISCVNSFDCDLTAVAANEKVEIATTTTAHTHNWVAVNKTVHHDEVGHWETKNKPYTVIITYSGKVVNSKEYNRPTFYDGLKALGCWDSSYVNYHSDKSMTGTNFTSFDFGTNSDAISDDTFSAIKDYYNCGSTTSCNKRTIMETTYNSWDELSNDLAFYKSEFGLDLSYAKENCYEKTWVVDKAAYDETVVDHYECSCGATKDSTGKYITEYTWSDDCKKCTASKYSINNPQQATTENGTISSKVKQNATCSAKGITTYTATFKNTAFKTQTKNLADIAMTAHKWSDWKCSAVNVSGDTVTMAHSCTVCKKSETKTVKYAIQRLAGAGRYASAANISKAGFPDGSGTVILAYGLNYADALAGVPLAKAMNAPILLTTLKTLPAETLAEIERLNAKKVIILGGTSAVSADVEKALTDKKLEVERIADTTRFETAAKIADKMQQQNENKAPTDVFFVYYNGFADALSVSAAAAVKGAPIVYLTTNGALNADTAAYLADLKKAGSVKNAYVIGGTSVISDDMATKAANALGLAKATRVAGANRFETCVAVNEKFADVLGGDMLCVATGMDFPDALAGGVYAAKKKAPLFLINGKVKTPSLNDKQKAFLKVKGADSITAFGGTSVVPDDHIADIAKNSI